MCVCVCVCVCVCFCFCFCVYTYVSWFVFLSLCFFLNVGNGVRIYYDSLYFHIRLCIVIVCLFRTDYLYECWAILSLIARVYVCLLMGVSIWISVVVFLTLSVWMPQTVFGCVVTDCTYIGTSLVSLFVWLFIFVFGYIVTDCTNIGTFQILRFCLSLFPSDFLSVRVYYYR